jgi:Cu(I)/Ag(I) efflux system membrane fusion protein
LFLLLLLAASSAPAQDIRARTRPSPRGTTVSKSQAVELTLTLTEAAIRPIQSWVRTAGAIDRTGRILTATLDSREAALVKIGQRVRAFPPESKSSMYQAWVTRLVPQNGRALVEATLSAQGREQSVRYVMEIVVEQGRFLSVPNEAILEEGDKQIVYVEQQPGQYLPKEIHTGIQGELYTQVLHGLTEGDQVVTFGSFFIDSEHKLKALDQGAPSNDHQLHH